MTTETFLTREEVKTLTGFSYPTKQAKQCREMGIPFYTNRRGYPMILRDVLTGKSSKVKAKENESWQPPEQAG